MKDAIKTAYIAHLQQAYPTIYLTGSSAMAFAEAAAGQALAGRLRLQGECWSLAVFEVTGERGLSRDDLKGLPE